MAADARWNRVGGARRSRASRHASDGPVEASSGNCSLGPLDALESEGSGACLGGEADAHGVAVLDLALEDRLRERILDAALDEAPQRPRPVDRVVAFAGEEVDHLGIGRERDLAVGQAAPELRELEPHDLAERLRRERIEYEDFVDAVQELGAEVTAQRLE